MNQFPQKTSDKFHRILPLDANLSQLFRDFLAEKFEIGLKPKSINHYFETIQAFDFLTKADFDRNDFIAFVAENVAEKNWSKRTLVNHLRRLCAFNRWLFYQSLVLRLHRAPKMSNKPKRRDLPMPDEWQRMFDDLRTRYESATLGRRKTRWRDYLIARILFDTGMRISELANLRVADLVIYDHENFWLFISDGKTESAERCCPISEKLTDEIRAYLWTFKVQNKKARIFTTKTGKPLNTEQWCKDIKAYGQSLHIEADITPHVFRHNFILDFIVRGGSAFDLQARLGHADLKMTDYYFNQVRRLMPFVQVSADINKVKAKLIGRANFFSKRNFTEDK